MQRVEYLSHRLIIGGDTALGLGGSKISYHNFWSQISELPLFRPKIQAKIPDDLFTLLVMERTFE